jgi:CRP-like cAMP-binding protein
MTNAKEKFEQICTHIEIFKKLRAVEVIHLVDNIQFVRFKNGEVLFSQGSSQKQLFILVSGSVVVEQKNEFDEICVLATFEKPLTSFGEVSYLTHSVHSTRLRAIKENTTIISFTINEKLDPNIYCKAYAQLYKNLAINIANRLKDANGHCFDDKRLLTEKKEPEL